jgi:hypothetical protein
VLLKANFGLLWSTTKQLVSQRCQVDKTDTALYAHLTAAAVRIGLPPVRSAARWQGTGRLALRVASVGLSRQ